MITLALIIFTTIFSISAFNNSDLFFRHQFNPYIVHHRKEWHRFFTHALLHADWLHLIMNMFVLFIFGSAVEQYMVAYFGAKGYLFYLLLYVASIPAASFPTFEKYKDSSWYNSVGASGAVSAVLFSGILFNPMSQICLYGVTCFPGIIWGIIYLIYSYYMANKGGDNINHEAHFSGAVFGVLFTLALKPALGSIFVESILSSF